MASPTQGLIPHERLPFTIRSAFPYQEGVLYEERRNPDGSATYRKVVMNEEDKDFTGRYLGEQAKKKLAAHTKSSPPSDYLDSYYLSDDFLEDVLVASSMKWTGVVTILQIRQDVTDELKYNRWLEFTKPADRVDFHKNNRLTIVPVLREEESIILRNPEATEQEFLIILTRLRRELIQSFFSFF